GSSARCAILLDVEQAIDLIDDGDPRRRSVLEQFHRRAWPAIARVERTDELQITEGDLSLKRGRCELLEADVRNQHGTDLGPVVEMPLQRTARLLFHAILRFDEIGAHEHQEDVRALELLVDNLAPFVAGLDPYLIEKDIPIEAAELQEMVVELLCVSRVIPR